MKTAPWRFDAACDPDVLRPGIERGLERAGGVPVEIVDVEMSRAYPRKEGGLTLELRARLRHAGSTELVPLVLGGHLLGESEDWPGYVAARPGEVLVFEEARLVVPLFPFDPKLPLLPQLLRPDDALALLRQAGVTRLEQASALVPRLIGYRLERRCVVRHLPVDAAQRAAAPALVTKVLRPRHMAPVQKAMHALAAAGATNLAPPTRAVDAGRGLYVMEEVAGRSLHELDATREFAAGCEAAGHALARLHALPKEVLPGRGVDDALRPLERLVELACAFLPPWSEGLRDMCRAVRAKRPADLDHRTSMVHGDFYDKQLLCAAGHTVILDWDGLACGDPAQDHGNFTAHVALRAAQAPEVAAPIELGAAAFKHGYGARSSEFAARACWWEAATLVRLAALYGLRRRWRHLVPVLLHHAGRSLERQARVAMLLGLLVAIAGTPRCSHAAPPEYMRIGPHVGRTLEISGQWTDDRVFVASNLEALPQARRPQLRGAIEAVDVGAREIVVFGVRIRVAASDSSGAADSLDTTLAGLQPGQRVEVSCAVDERGTWTARRLVAQAVKASDKIKGTITRAAVDGAPPDTIEVSGLRILLVAATGVSTPEQQDSRLERILFPDLVRGDRNRPTWTLSGEKLRLIGESSGQVRSRRDFDLSPQFDSDASESLSELRLGVAGHWSGPVRTFAEVRMRGRATLHAQQPATLPGDNVQTQLTQLYVLLRAGGRHRAALQLGRLDLDEPRQWLFDEYLDAARLVLYGPGPLVLEGAFIRPFHPIDPAFATWTDVFAMARWYFDARSHAAAWLLVRRDRDPVRDRQPVWIGARYWGRLRGGFSPWLDSAVMRGEDRHRTLRAWCLDAGATWFGASLPGGPSITAAYAVGSGDASTSDGVDGNFRQTGYEDNWARFGGVVSHKIYGSLLDPELSNLEIRTLGVGARPVRDASIELFWHGYRQLVARDKLPGSNLLDPPARPNGASRDVGWTVEIVAAAPQLWRVLRATWTFALFRPGEAFNPRHADATWQQLELTARF